MSRVQLPEVHECDHLAAAGELHRGLIKAMNQDRVVVWGPGVPIVDKAGGGYLFGVVDGMGGTKGGEVAAERTVTTLLEYYRSPAGTGPDRVEALLHEANRRICAEQLVVEERDTMGCVVTLLWVDEERAELFQVGDTRAYGVDADGITLLTEDDRDRLGRVTNWIGNPRGITVARRALSRDGWEFLFVCSDGVPLELNEHRMLEIVRGKGEPAGIVQQLLEGALGEQGRDNLSVVCVELY